MSVYLSDGIGVEYGVWSLGAARGRDSATVPPRRCRSGRPNPRTDLSDPPETKRRLKCQTAVRLRISPGCATWPLAEMRYAITSFRTASTTSSTSRSVIFG